MKKHPAVGSLAKKRRRVTENKLNDDDYILPKGQGVWMTVRNLALRIKDTGEGVSVIVYKSGSENEPSLAETWVLFSEAD